MSPLKVGWILLLLTGLGVLGFGLIVAAFPGYAGANEEGLLRALGVATTGMGIFGVTIATGPYRRREKWAWFTLWFYPIFWTLHLVGGLPPGTDHIHQIVFIAISLLGLLLPARQFFPRTGPSVTSKRTSRTGISRDVRVRPRRTPRRHPR